MIEYSPPSGSADNNPKDSDCIIIGNPTVMPRPRFTTSEGLFKKENDEISHDKPFMTTVSDATMVFLESFNSIFFEYFHG